MTGLRSGAGSWDPTTLEILAALEVPEAALTESPIMVSAADLEALRNLSLTDLEITYVAIISHLTSQPPLDVAGLKQPDNTWADVALAAGNGGGNP